MDYSTRENFSLWMSNETSSAFAPGSADSNQSDVVQNGTAGVYDSREEFLADIRRRHIIWLYGSHFYTLFIVHFLLCMLGYITNILNVIVLSKTSMYNSINLFLLSLAISEILQITTIVSHIVHYFAGFKMFPHYEWVVFFIASTFFENSFIYISNWLVAVIGMWRCVAITWPFQVREVCSPHRAKVTIASIVFLSFLFSTPILYMISYVRYDFQGHDIYDNVFSKIALHQDGAVLKMFWGLQLLQRLVPMLIMFAATVWLIVTLNRIRRQRIKKLRKDTCSSANHRITLMLTILSVFYWLSNIADRFMFFIPIASRNDEELQEDYQNRTDIIRIIMITKSSISFFIYYGLGEGFRKKFHDIFLRCISHRNKKKSISDCRSESSTVRSKSFDVGPLRKASADGHFNTHLQELNQVIALKNITR